MLVEQIYVEPLNSRASSPVSDNSIDVEVRANFAEAARLREQANMQE